MNQAKLEDFNTIEIFDKENKLIDGASITRGDFISMKYSIRY
jgi:DNA integrity scanning protein DisA with diadenylate cyclase activity